MLAPHHELGNLVVLVDVNRLSFDGRTEDLLPLEPLADKWRAFRWQVREIDGHNMTEILAALDGLPPADSLVPTVILAHTVKGHGVSFMENNVGWHAGMLSDEDFDRAMSDIAASFDTTRQESLA